MYHIYKIKNNINGKIYIGYTSNINKRWSQHKRLYKSETTKPLYIAFNKYGIENFSFSILYSSNIKDYTKNVMEKFYIKKYKSISPNGYNLTRGGDGGVGVTSENATIYNNKRVYDGTHVFQNPDFISRVSDRMKTKNPMFDDDIKKRAKEKLKATMKQRRDDGICGKPKTDEHKRKLSEINKEKANRPIINILKGLYQTLNIKPSSHLWKMSDTKLEQLKYELEQLITNI